MREQKKHGRIKILKISTGTTTMYCTCIVESKKKSGEKMKAIDTLKKGKFFLIILKYCIPI